MDALFEDYIKNINNLNNFDNLELKNNEDEKQDLLNYIVECENKLKAHEKKKKRLMEQYVAEEIQFDNYKQLIEIIDEQYNTLANELEKTKSEIIEEKPSSISREDIILDLQQNWQNLNDKERFIFLQRFVKKIVINSEKGEKRDEPINKIVRIEFE